MSMELKIIRTKKQYQECLDWVDRMFDKKVKPNTPDGEKLQVVLLLIKQYEDANYPIPMPDPIEAIKLRMQELGLKNKDLVGEVGSKGYVSALLNKRKPLTLELARLFHHKLDIPAEILLA
jgi:HTH-type transcriptional regulator / antitoxin HigA